MAQKIEAKTPVSQDAQEVVERARQWIEHYNEVVEQQDGKIARQLRSMYHDTARLITDLAALQSHADAARPKVSEDTTIVEILAPDGTVHYRRPWNDPDVQEAFNTLGYSVRKAQ